MSDGVSQAAWGSWAFPFWATLGLLATALLYLRGWSRIRRTRPQIFPPWRAWCFLAGLLALWVAIASPLDTLDGLLLVAHMTQHLILMSVVPPLLLLGAPMVPLLRGLPQSALRDGLGPFFRTPALHRVFRVLTHPVFAFFAMNIAYIGWHVPPAYELALRSPGWHEVEHACFLGTSLLFWFPVIQPWPSVSPRIPLDHVALSCRRRSDQYRAGCVPDLCRQGDLSQLRQRAETLRSLRTGRPGRGRRSDVGDRFHLLLCAFGSDRDPSALAAISPRCSRLAGLARKYRNPAASAFRPAALTPDRQLCCAARYGRMALQSIAFVTAVLVIADGFLGHPMGAMNLAGVLPWTYVRAFGVVALLVLGNIFCLSCPFMLPRELGHRLGLARFKWPRWLRSKWIAIVLMILFFWSYEAFALWDHPQRTAWLLIAYFAAAFLVDTFFRGASFCKYVCPLGQFNFAASLLSPFTLQARSQATCERCTTHDCIAGNPQQRGCELQLYMPQKAGNMDCTLCMDCVKACPHDNIGLFARCSSKRRAARSGALFDWQVLLAHRHRGARPGGGDRRLCECRLDGDAQAFSGST